MLINTGRNRSVLFISRTTVAFPSPTGIMLVGTKLVGVKVNMPYLELDFSNQGLSSDDANAVLQYANNTYDTELTWRIIDLRGNSAMTDPIAYYELIDKGFEIYGDVDFWYPAIRMEMNNVGDVRYLYSITPSETETRIVVNDSLSIYDDQDYTYTYPNKDKKNTSISTKSPSGLRAITDVTNFLRYTSGGLKSIIFDDIVNYDDGESINLVCNTGLHNVEFNSTPINKIGTIDLTRTNVGRPFTEPDFEVTDFYQPAYDPLGGIYGQDMSLFFIEGFDWTIQNQTVNGLRGYQDGFATYGVNTFERIIPANNLKQWFYFGYIMGQSGYPYGTSWISLEQDGIEIYNSNTDFAGDGISVGGNNGALAFEFEITDFINDLTIVLHFNEFQDVRTNSSGISYKFSDSQLQWDGVIDFSKFENGIDKITLRASPWIKEFIFPNTSEPLEFHHIQPEYYTRGFQNNVENIHIPMPIKGILYGGFRNKKLKTFTLVDTTELVTGILFYANEKLETLDLSPIKNFVGGTMYLYSGLALSYLTNLTSFTPPVNGITPNIYMIYNTSIEALDFNTNNFEAHTSIQIRNNTALKTINFAPSATPISLFYAYQNDLTGVLDLSMLTISGSNPNLRMYFMPNLTGVTFSNENNGNGGTSSFFYIYSCNLTGTLDLSNYALSGYVALNRNPLLTNILWKTSSRPIRSLDINRCGFSGVLDLTPLEDLYDVFNCEYQVGSGITRIDFHTNSWFRYFRAHGNDLEGMNHSDLGYHTDTEILVSGNLNMTYWNQPSSPDTSWRFKSVNISYSQLYKINWMHSTCWDYEGAVLVFHYMDFTTAQFNEFLYDLDQASSAGFSRIGDWYGGTYNYDSSSGGFDGVAAMVSLVSKGWVFQ